ncbi:MAG TPA: hypothetical protein VMB22_02595 [Verrucomicrobiae bacterium]|nr:hypothetical protein [Verrucomicrobiae bacterium]
MKSGRHFGKNDVILKNLTSTRKIWAFFFETQRHLGQKELLLAKTAIFWTIDGQSRQRWQRLIPLSQDNVGQPV